MRFELIDIQSCETVDDVRNLVKISPDAFHNLTKYAGKLLNEATLMLAHISRIESKGEILSPQGDVTKEYFVNQRSTMNKFFRLAKEGGMIGESKRPLSKAEMKRQILGKFREVVKE